MSTSAKQFVETVTRQDLAGLRDLLRDAPDPAAFVNEPLFCFGQRAVHMAKTSLPLLDVLLEFGADINLKSDWEPGGYHVLEETTPAEGAPLVERGAVPDIFAYTGWDDVVQVARLLAEDPGLVHATGGDGVRPLHYAQSVDMARLLLDAGADMEARCCDHESTAAQYMVTKRPAVLGFLLDRGAHVDLFMAVALGDVARVASLLDAEPESAHWRIGEGRYDVPTRDPAGIQGGNIYLWRLGGGLSPIEVASRLGKDDVADLLYPHSAPRDRFASAVQLGQTERARSVLAEHPDVMESGKPPLTHLLGDLVWSGNQAGVVTFLACGVSVDARWHYQHTPLIIAALRGFPDIMDVLLAHGADLEARNDFGGTAVGAVAFGSVTTPEFGTNPDGDYAACARILVKAGASVDFTFDTGAPSVIAILKGSRTE